MSSKDSGHWVNFIQRILTSTADVGGRVNLFFGSGFQVEEMPDDDAIGISLDSSALAQSSWKMYAETRSVTNIADLSAVTSVGGVTLSPGMRVGVFAQSDDTKNGLYQYADGVGLFRSSDADSDGELRGAEVRIRKGDGAGERWRCSNTGAAVPDVSSITWVKVESNGDKAKLDGIESAAQAVTWEHMVEAASAADEDIDINGMHVTGAADPESPSDYVTLQYFEDNQSVSSSVEPLRLIDGVLDWYPTAQVSMNPDGTERGFKDCAGVSGAELAFTSAGAMLISSASETRSFSGGSTCLRQWGAAGTRVDLEAENTVTTNANTVEALSFAIPSNVVGKVTMHVTIADITNGEAAAYELKYKFKRHNGGSPSLTAATIVLLEEDDAAWSSRVELSGNDLVLNVTGDAANACVGRARWVIEYNTYTPV